MLFFFSPQDKKGVTVTPHVQVLFFFFFHLVLSIIKTEAKQLFFFFLSNNSLSHFCSFLLQPDGYVQLSVLPTLKKKKTKIGEELKYSQLEALFFS